MAFVIFWDGEVTVTLTYVERKPNGSFQYRRRIPHKLQLHHSGRKFYVRSLGRDPKLLASKAGRITAELNETWGSLRSGRAQGLAEARHDLQSLLQAHSASEQRQDRLKRYIVDDHQLEPAAKPSILLSEALSLYLEHHPKGEHPKFQADNERVVQRLITQLGDLPLAAYTRKHAEEFRDDLLLSNATASVRRRLNIVVAIFNKARKEKQLQIVNPFEELGIPREHEDDKKREPFTMEELTLVAQACHNLDDDIRHIIALQLDTGARAGEIIGLRVEDVILDHEIPHLRIRPFGKVRSLKTPASERDIPLVGQALWAATRAVEARRNAREGSPWLFPRYASDNEIKATHASNTLNKWLRSLDGVSAEKTTHCFRHAMRDRLRAGLVPHDIQEVIGGWGQRSVGQGYGRGYPLAVLKNEMDKIRLSE